MSIRQRLVTLAKSNLNTLLDRTADRLHRRDLEEVPDHELEAELARRQRMRRIAEELGQRSQRVAGEARTRFDAAKERAKDVWQQAKTRVKAHSPHLEEHYRALNLEPGVTLDEIKTAYRKLMRKYHPDLHPPGSQKHRAASKISQKLTVAYNALKKELGGS